MHIDDVMVTPQKWKCGNAGDESAIELHHSRKFQQRVLIVSDVFKDVGCDDQVK